MTKSRLQEELGKRDPFDSLEQEACLNLARTHDHVFQQFAGLMAEHGISGPQYNVLRILRGMGGDGVPCLEIAGRMVTRTPDITRLVDRLLEAGLVQRERTAQDRRVVLVKLTAAGRALLERLDKPVLALHGTTLGHMSAAELTELNRLLVKARYPEEK